MANQFNPADYVEKIWDREQVIEMLEDRCRGYGGTLRALLATAAATIREREEKIFQLERRVAKIKERELEIQSEGASSDKQEA